MYITQCIYINLYIYVYVYIYIQFYTHKCMYTVYIYIDVLPCIGLPETNREVRNPQTSHTSFRPGNCHNKFRSVMMDHGE